MQARVDVIRFGVVFAVLSVVLGWLFWSANGVLGAFELRSSMLAVPVISAMLASIGFSWKRKLAYAGVTLVLYALSSAAAETSGLAGLVAAELATNTSLPSVVTILYMAWLTTFPLVMLVLCVGRRPTLLWSRQAG